MSEEPEDVPAFPNRFGYGMTLRDYFAGQVIAGLAAPVAAQGRVRRKGGSAEEVAASAYQLADAMLRERVK